MTTEVKFRIHGMESKILKKRKIILKIPKNEVDL